MNKRKMKSIMTLNGDTGKSLASYLKISNTRFCAKLNNRKGAEFTRKEIAGIMNKYKLSPDEVIEIFFEEMRSSQDTKDKE